MCFEIFIFGLLNFISEGGGGSFLLNPITVFKSCWVSLEVLVAENWELPGRNFRLIQVIYLNYKTIIPKHS